jgi:hypothetical protein
VRTFIDQAAQATAQTGDHASALAEAIRRLPGLLGAARPALDQLDAVATRSIPIVADVRAAAPSIRRILATVPAFSRAAIPAFRSLGPVSVRGQRTAARDRGPIAELRKLAKVALPRAQRFDELMVNLRQRGFWESLLSVLYYGTAASSRFDTTSHLLPAHLQFTPCSFYATTPSPACSANFSTTAPAVTRAHRRAARAHRDATSPAASTPAGTTTAPTTTSPATPAAPTPSSNPLTQVLQGLTSYLLK